MSLQDIFAETTPPPPPPPLKSQMVCPLVHSTKPWDSLWTDGTHSSRDEKKKATRETGKEEEANSHSTMFH